MGKLKDYYHEEITRDLEDERAYEMWLQEQQQKEYEADWREVEKSDSNLDLVRDLAVVCVVALIVYGVGVIVMSVF